jgi:hypothetical protein
MGLASYIEVITRGCAKRVLLGEAETDTSKDDTQSDREWLLAALLALAVGADEDLARGIDAKTVSSQLKSDWMSALKRAGTSAFKKGVALRASESAKEISKIARESERLRAQLEEQSSFLANFADDYVGGVTTEPRRMGFMNRAHLYAMSMIGYFNLGAIAGGNPSDQIYWRLGACDHCTDCPALHVSGPYTPQTLPTVPGLGSTRCGHWCCCYLYIVPSLLQSVLSLSLGGAAAMAAAVDAGASTADRIMDTRLQAGYASRMSIDTEDEAYAQRAAELQSDLDSLVAANDVEFEDQFPLGGPVIGMEYSGIVVPDLLYDKGIDSASLRSIREKDIETFLDDQFERGAE